MGKLKIFAIALVSVLVLLAAAGGVLLWKYAGQDVVPRGVMAGKMELGGMLIDDAVALLDQYEDALANRHIIIEANQTAKDSKQWKVAELGYKAEFAGAKEALLKLREGDLWTRAKYRYHFQMSFPLSQSWDRAAFESALRQQWSWIESSETRNAEREITENDEVRYTPHTDAYRLDLADLVRQVNSWTVLEKDKVGEEWTDEMLSFKAELPITVVHPEVTLEKLQEEGIDRRIMSFTTDFATSPEGRAHNVTITAEELNDWYLKPGEVFSYSDLIAKVEKEHEYREAPVIMNGRLVPGIGGGICQVSSTLYQAVLRAGLEIVERRNHSLPVAYLPLGFDATYATDAIDFKFRNSTGKALLIRTEVEDRKVTVKLFGTMPENVRYDIESVTLDTIQPGTKQTVNPSLPVGKSVVLEQGKPGYVVETYRTLVRDGEVVSRERVSKDTYRVQPTLIEVGPSSPDATPQPQTTPAPGEGLVEDGV